MKHNFFYSIILVVCILAGCDPYEEADIAVPALPAAPTFSMEALADNPNKILVKDLSGTSFNRVWDFGSNADGNTALVPTSTLAIDTITYLKAGTYTVTLYIASNTGGGTAQSSQTITIDQDAEVGCDPKTALLTGDCLPAGKCWTFAQVAGAVTVGPTQGSSEWFSSSASGLAPEQYDDSFCFTLDGASFQYNNNGQTIDPWNGFVAADYTPPTDHTWIFSEGTGTGGADQIILTQGSFLGVWNASNVYDIVTLTETELVVQTPFDDNTGWFELYFVAL